MQNMNPNKCIILFFSAEERYLSRFEVIDGSSQLPYKNYRIQSETKNLNLLYERTYENNIATNTRYRILGAGKLDDSKFPKDKYTDDFRKDYIGNLISYLMGIDESSNIYLFLHEKDLYVTADEIDKKYFSSQGPGRCIWTITTEGRKRLCIEDNIHVVLFQHSSWGIVNKKFIRINPIDTTIIDKLLKDYK